MVKTVTFGMAGFGTVGKALLGILKEKHESIAAKYGVAFKLVSLFEHDGMLHDPDGIPAGKVLDARNIRDLPEWKAGRLAIAEIEHQAFDVLVEMTPTNVKTAEPAFTHFKKALGSGKHVVSSNKGPLLLFFDEVMSLAKQSGRKVLFEATVGSGIPVFSVVANGLQGNTYTRIEAILNGTSNYILTRMANEKIDFGLALKEAQERGYAEADPSLDIDGHDAAGKIVILANAVMNMKKSIKDVKVEGIRHVNLDAILMAEREGFVIKHLGIVERNGELEVKPKLVPKNSPLGAGVTGTVNAIKLVTDLSGEIILIGKGAGGMEAASAVLADMISLHA